MFNQFFIFTLHESRARFYPETQNPREGNLHDIPKNTCKMPIEIRNHQLRFRHNISPHNPVFSLATNHIVVWVTRKSVANKDYTAPYFSQEIALQNAEYDVASLLIKGDNGNCISISNQHNHRCNNNIPIPVLPNNYCKALS